MKILSISAILVTLAAAPVNAGLMTNQEGDPIAQCGWKAARLLVNTPENARIFPEDIADCRERDGEAGNESRIDGSPLEPADGPAGSERVLEIATLSPASSH